MCTGLGERWPHPAPCRVSNPLLITMGSPEGQGEAAGPEEGAAGLQGQHGLGSQGVTSMRPRKISFIEKINK